MEVSTVLCTSPGPGVHPILGFSSQQMMWGELMWPEKLSLSGCRCIWDQGGRGGGTPMSSPILTSFPFICRSMQTEWASPGAEYRLNSSVHCPLCVFPHIHNLSHTEPALYRITPTYSYKQMPCLTTNTARLIAVLTGGYLHHSGGGCVFVVPGWKLPHPNTVLFFDSIIYVFQFWVQFP